MTPLTYWTYWALAGAAFVVVLAIVLHVVVTKPLVRAIQAAGEACR